MSNCMDPRCCTPRRMMGATASPAPDLDQAAAEYRLNTGETLAEASKHSPLVLVFLRHFGCTFTRQILRGLEDLQHQANKHGARLVLIHMLKQGDEVHYLGDHSPVACIADPKCQLYKAFGLGKGGIIQLLGPKVWWLGMLSVMKGCGVGRLAGNGLQMPGTFIFHQQAIVSAQRAKSAADMPDIQALFERWLGEARP